MVVYSFVETAEMRVRRCEPYLFVYTTRCKARWIGREALEVFVTEFGMNPPEYYEAALTDGRITINKRLVGCSHVFRNGDVVDHRAHRHEPPVDAGPIAIVANDAHVLALDKPASMPMHPCGAYHHNSLTGILAEDFSENGFRAARVLRASESVVGCTVVFDETSKTTAAELKMVHRLDRLTSGLVLFAKSQEVARDLCERIRDGGARKTYLARVLGNFPHNAPKHLQDTCAVEKDELQRKKKLKAGEDSRAAAAARLNDNVWRILPCGSVEVSCAIACESHKNGVYATRPLAEDPTAKPCVTRMRLLRRLEDGTSIVECTPLTGRTHQIRLHLLWMGHAIANDGCYGGDRITNFPKVDGSWSYETELPKWATAPAAAAPQAKPSSCALC